MSNPSDINLEGAVDLADNAERQRRLDEVKAEIAERERMAYIQMRAATWDRAMQRAFKGIVARPIRHRALQRAITPDEAAA